MELPHVEGASRFLASAPSSVVTPINFTRVPLCESLTEALGPLVDILSLASVFDYLALEWVEGEFGVEIPYGLTKDEAAAIYLYTREEATKVCSSHFLTLRACACTTDPFHLEETPSFFFSFPLLLCFVL